MFYKIEDGVCMGNDCTAWLAISHNEDLFYTIFVGRVQLLLKIVLSTFVLFIWLGDLLFTA